MNTTADPYAVLGVSRDADQESITDAYHRAMRKAHPDMPGGTEEKAATVSAAYEILSDPARRAAHDLDARRGTVTTDPAATATAGPVQAPAEGPISFWELTVGHLVLLAVALVSLLASLLVPPTFVPVLAVTLVSGGVATYAAAKYWSSIPPTVGVIPAAALVTSVNPISRWLAVGTWPLVAFAGLALLFVGVSVLNQIRRIRRLVGVTQEKRWVFTAGQTTHPFLLAAGNATGWVGLTGDGPFSTVLMNGRHLILLATATATYPGESLAITSGQLLRTRPGSTVALPDAAVDLPLTLPRIPDGFQGRFAVFVPGVAAGAGPIGDVPVIGEADLLAWMAAVPVSRLDRADVLTAADLVS